MIALERAGSVIEGSDHDHGLDKLDHRRVDFAKTGVMLPPTCGGSTRNDTAIFHPAVAEWIYDMSVPSEH